MADKNLAEVNESSFMTKLLLDSSSIQVRRDYDDIKDSEAFIDKKFDEIKFETLTKDLETFKSEVKDIVKILVNKEKRSTSLNSSMYMEKEERNSLVSFLMSENNFLKEELKYKNHIIGVLLEQTRTFNSNSLNIDDRLHIQKNSDQNIISRNGPKGDKLNVASDQVVNRAYNKINKKSEDVSLTVNHDRDEQKRAKTVNVKTQSSSAKQQDVAKKTICIAGDSIIKNINPWKLSRKHSVKVHSHPGATTEDMVDFIKPDVRKSPDVIVLHVGTNDISNKINTKKKLKTLIKTIRDLEYKKKIEIAISSVITREGFESEVGELNSYLKSFCESSNLFFIDNSNVDISCLNRSKLHCNKKGDALLAKNFLNFLQNI